MTEINLWSFLSVFFFQVIGALAHYRKLKQTKRRRGGYFDYLFADKPGRSTAVFLALLASSWLACTSGKADLLNPEMLWELLAAGKLHIASIDAVVSAILFGYAFDSIADKGDK